MNCQNYLRSLQYIHFTHRHYTCMGHSIYTSTRMYAYAYVFVCCVRLSSSQHTYMHTPNECTHQKKKVQYIIKTSSLLLNPHRFCFFILVYFTFLNCNKIAICSVRVCVCTAAFIFTPNNKSKKRELFSIIIKFPSVRLVASKCLYTVQIFNLAFV